MNREIIELREVVTKLVPMLTGKGLKVTQSGTRAFVRANMRTHKPELVNIPCIPDNATPDFVSAIQGFIDHEVGHVLHTDWKYYGGEGIHIPHGTPEAKALAANHNTVEDPYVEREQMKLFPGSKSNLAKLHEYFLQKITTPALQQVKGNEKKEFSVLWVPAIRALSGQQIFQNFMDAGDHWNHPMVKSVVMALSDETMHLLKHAKNTEETLKAAQEIHDILFNRKLDEPEEPEKPEEPEDEQEDQPQPPVPPQPEPEPEDDTQGEQQDDETGEGESEDKPEQPAGEGDGDGERDHSESEDEGEAGPGEDGEDGGEEADGDEQGEQGEDAGEDEGEDGDAEAEQEAGDGDAESGDDSDEADGSDADDDRDGQSGDADDDGAAEGDADDADEGAGAAGAEDDDAGEDDGDDEDLSGTEGGNAGDEEDGAEDGGAAGGSGDEDDEAEAGTGQGDADMGENDGGGSAEEEGDGENEGGGFGGDASSSMFELDASDFEPVDLSNALQQALTEMAMEAIGQSEYSVFTRDEDKISIFDPDKLKIKVQDEWVPKMEDQVGHMIGPMQKDIERMMAAQSHVLRTPGHTRGKLHGPSLYRVMQGDPRVFTQKEEHRSKDTAVMLLIDNSGSMHGTPIAVAMHAGYALAATLERVNVANQVMGFTTGNLSRSAYDALSKDPMVHKFSRTSTIVMPIFKDFDERVTPAVKRRIAAQINAQVGMETNTDGESLEYAAMALMRRREKRKVMLVMSDGQPVGSGTRQHLKATVENLTKIGIETVGIGIGTTAVQAYYPRSMVLNNVADLPKTVMGELKRILTA